VNGRLRHVVPDAGTLPGVGDGADLARMPPAKGRICSRGSYASATGVLRGNVVVADNRSGLPTWPADVPVARADVANEQPLSGWLVVVVDSGLLLPMLFASLVPVWAVLKPQQC